MPRVPAPPEVSRAERHALTRDEHGPVGIRPADKTDGLGLIGGQGTGKTSVMCRTRAADAPTTDCAVIVLMPKPDDALKALSVVPPRRHGPLPRPRRARDRHQPAARRRRPDAVADAVVEAFRDDQRGRRDPGLLRPLPARRRRSAQPGRRDEGQPTLWDMYRLLLPPRPRFRDGSSRRSTRPALRRHVDVLRRELPADLRDAPSQTTAKLDAPRNKMRRCSASRSTRCCTTRSSSRWTSVIAQPRRARRRRHDRHLRRGQRRGDDAVHPQPASTPRCSASSSCPRPSAPGSR